MRLLLLCGLMSEDELRGRVSQGEAGALTSRQNSLFIHTNQLRAFDVPSGCNHSERIHSSTTNCKSPFIEVMPGREFAWRSGYPKRSRSGPPPAFMEIKV